MSFNYVLQMYTKMCDWDGLFRLFKCYNESRICYCPKVKDVFEAVII